jgi:hypothetical protein
MRVVTWSLVLAWLSLGLFRVATDGRARWSTDRRLSALTSAAERRAVRFGPQIGPRLESFEKVLVDIRARGAPARVLVAAPVPQNVYESLAWHLLDPAAILRAKRNDLEGEARERGAGWWIGFDAVRGWRAEPVEEAR